MIYSSLKAQSAQCKWPEPFQKAFDFLKNSNLEHMEVGRYEIDGDDIYAMIQKQTTAAPENKKAESQSPFVIPFATNTSGTITSINRISTHDTALTPLLKLVSTASCATSEAMEPNSV